MSQRLNIALAVVFMIVAIVATVNTIRLNTYIRQTLPRDAEQESCQLATLQALRVWAVGRGQIEHAKEERDAALAPVWQSLEHGQQPSPDVAAAAEREFQHVETVRSSVEQMLRATPIPNCKLELGR